MSTLFDQLTGTVNGLAIGAGTAYRFTEIRGLDEDGDPRTSDTPRPGRDGDYPGTDLRGSRVVEVDLVTTPAAVDAGLVLQALRRALVAGAGTMTVTGLPGLPALWLAGSVRRQRIPTDRDAALGAVRPQFQFYVPDPNRYSLAESVQVLDLREVIGSVTPYDTGVRYDVALPFDGVKPAVVFLHYPIRYPIRYAGRAGLSTPIPASNLGIYPTAPTIIVWGPSPSFTLVQLTTGQRWSYGAPVAAGDFLAIDMRAMTVLLNGTASRRNLVTLAGWFDLPPGDSAVAFVPDDSPVGARVELHTRSAY